jgi:hypothetical protein
MSRMKSSLGSSDEFDGAAGAIELDIDVGVRPAESCDLLFTLLGHGGVEQVAAVVAEGVVGQEALTLAGRWPSRTKTRPTAGGPAGTVGLLGSAVVVNPPAGLAVYTPSAPGAEEIRTVWSAGAGVGSGGGAGANAVAAEVSSRARGDG